MLNRDAPNKAVIVTIYDINGAELMSTLGKSGLHVTSFKYKFDDSNDDVCTLTFLATDKAALDNTNLSYGSVIQVNWGYMGGLKTPKVTLVVRDIETNYNPNSIKVSLECTDFVTYLKTARGDDSDELSIVNYISKKCKTARGFSYNVVIKEFSNIIYKQSKTKHNTDSNEVSYFNPDLVEVPDFDYYNHGWKLKKKIVSDIPDNSIFFEGASDRLYDFLTKPQTFTDGNRSPYQVIRDIMKYAPNGPWYVSGRGDTITIHNRDLANKPTKTYTYMGKQGNLLSANVKSKYESFEQRSVSSPYLNPEDKIAYYEDIYIKELDNIQDISKIFKEGISDSERTKLLTDFIAVYRASKTYAIKRLRMDYTVEPDPLTGYLYDSEKTHGLGNIKFAKDPVTGEKVISQIDKTPTGLIYDPEGKSTMQTHYAFYAFMAPGLSANETRDMIDNEARSLEMDKVEINILTEGDPYLISESVVRINNIQKIHSGDYYLKSVEHIITAHGYKNQAEGFKITRKAAISGISQSAKQGVVDSDGNVLGGEGQVIVDRYQREQTLFYGWSIEIWIGSKHSVSQRLVFDSPDVETYVPLSDFIQSRDNLPLDQLVQELVNAKYRISTEPNVENR